MFVNVCVSDLQLCQICCEDNNEAELLLCDICDRGYHTYCIRVSGSSLICIIASAGPFYQNLTARGFEKMCMNSICSVCFIFFLNLLRSTGFIYACDTAQDVMHS